MPRKDIPLRIMSRNPKIRLEFRESRLKMDKTQKCMGIDLGMKESYIRLVENGHLNPSLKRILVFEKYFEIAADRLFPDLYNDVE